MPNTFLEAVHQSHCVATCLKGQVGGDHTSKRSLLCAHRSQQSIERGKIINFMSADVNNIIQFLNPAMADIVVAPITIIVAVGLLWRVIGCAHPSVSSSLLRGHIASSSRTVYEGGRAAREGDKRQL